MIINDIPLENLKAILASGTPLALETTEALVERLEIVGRRLDAMRRQRDGYMNEVRRKTNALEQVEAQVARVRETAEVLLYPGDYPGERDKAEDRIGRSLLRLLDGEQA